MMFDRSDLGAIAAGGVFGATVRWLATRTTGPNPGGWFVYSPNTTPVFGDPSIPWDTLGVNVAGCLILGVLTRALIQQPERGQRRVFLALGTGFCGSLTTFSTFATDSASLLGAGAQSDARLGLVYVATSVVAGGLAFVAGRRVVAAVSP